MSFSKIFKGEKQKAKKAEEAEKARIIAIINEVSEILQKRGANAYETMDVIANLQNRLNVQIAKILRDNHKEISRLNEDDSNKPEENRRQEDKK